MVPLSFTGEMFQAHADGALFWPRRGALLVADLHLEKASFFGRFGQFLPPHDSIETLERVERVIRQSGARAVWCLGDSFHDRDGGGRLSTQARDMLRELTARCDWVWITGNHDPIDVAPVGGNVMPEAMVDGICLRHQALPGERRPEISGHWHPKLKIRARGHAIRRRCFVRSANRLVLPAFGALTGGMRADDPALLQAVGTPAEALVVSADQLMRFNLS